MDTSELIINYTEVDFANAIRALLPSGDYWQETDNLALNNLILGMGAEFKVTNDEIQLSLLTDFTGRLFGWKISDYQALLITSGGTGTGTVYDDEVLPNVIFVSLDNNVRSEKAWREFERVRLPHTAIQWRYSALTHVQTQVASARYSRNIHPASHKVTL